MLGALFDFLCTLSVFLWDLLFLGMALFTNYLPRTFVTLSAIAGTAAYFTRARKPKSFTQDFSPGKCIAHRGAMLDAPQNTMAAIKYCLESECRHIELDVHVSRDGRCLLSHDPEINGVAIAATDWEKLSTLHVEKDHPMGEKFGATPPCLLDAAVDYLVQKEVSFVMDLKANFDPRLHTRILELFSKRPELNRSAIITSFNPFDVYKIRRTNPEIVGALSYRPRIVSMTQYNMAGPARKRFPDNPLKHGCAVMVDFLLDLVWRSGIFPWWCGASVLFIHKDCLSLADVQGWKRRGYIVCAWTANQPLEKQYVSRVLGCPYLTDTLVGEAKKTVF